MASAAAGPVGSGEPTDGDNVASTAVPKQTQGATFGERVNAGAPKAGDAGAPGSPVPDQVPGQTRPQSLQDENKSMLSIIR